MNLHSMNLHSKGKGIDNSTVQNESQPLELHGHLPECPVPSMNGLWGLPLHPEDAEANCICSVLRACELRVLRKEYELDEGDPYREVYRGGYAAALDAAEAAVAAIPAPHYCDEDWHNAIGEALIVIRALKEKP